ncbi:MAG: Gfo/Idh/MocA family oxidoreductase [candidate division WS1 bacterium]|nr:Gfo/Idh/MocA family oxidoreductase [candidate division WS1 bacterium]
MAIKVGFVGTGGIANTHLDTLSKKENVTITALCDVVLERAQEKADKYGGKAYADFRAMLDTEGLDALFICTPPMAHGEIEMAAVERRLPMFIEKPIARDLTMAAPILLAIAAADLITVVAYKYRWDAHVERARQMLAGKTHGLVSGWFWTGMPGVPWWRVQAQSGGQMVEQTTHIVDMARFLCGEITHVAAFEAHQVMRRLHRDATAADAATASLRFASGAVGTITNTYMLGAGGGGSGLDVIAHNFRLQVAGAKLQWWGPEESGELENESNGYVREVEAFLKAVETGDQSEIYSDYADAYRTLAVTEAVHTSAQQGGRVVEVAAG